MQCMMVKPIESAIDIIIKKHGYRGTKAELCYFFHWLRKKHALRAYLTNLYSNRMPNAHFLEFRYNTPMAILFWRKTQEGYDYWYEMWHAWNKHLFRHINRRIFDYYKSINKT